MRFSVLPNAYAHTSLTFSAAVLSIWGKRLIGIWISNQDSAGIHLSRNP